MNEQTPRGYPLPHVENLLSDDVERLRTAITSIDNDFNTHQQEILQLAELLRTNVTTLRNEQGADVQRLDETNQAQAETNAAINQHLQTLDQRAARLRILMLASL